MGRYEDSQLKQRTCLHLCYSTNTTQDSGLPSKLPFECSLWFHNPWTPFSIPPPEWRIREQWRVGNEGPHPCRSQDPEALKRKETRWHLEPTILYQPWHQARANFCHCVDPVTSTVLSVMRIFSASFFSPHVRAGWVRPTKEDCQLFAAGTILKQLLMSQKKKSKELTCTPPGNNHHHASVHCRKDHWNSAT